MTWLGEIHHHPEGLVYVRVGMGDAYYVDTPANLEIDSGGFKTFQLPGTGPDGQFYDEHIYTQGKRHCLMGGGNVIAGGDMPWEDGDKLIAAIPDLLVAQAKRTAPPPPPPPTAVDIKAEAMRRILTRFPDWKQRNMTARGIELLSVRVAGGTWSGSETAEATALQVAWDWVKAMREASNKLESAIPDDFTSDAYWPANPTVVLRG